jgi:HK97 family phage portal protein
MSLLTRMIPQLASPLPRAAQGERLSRPVSFVGGSSGPSLQHGGPRMSGGEALGTATVYRCVQTVTNPLAALEVGVQTTAADGTLGDLNKTHPMALLWNRTPNPMLSAYVLKSIMWQQLELSGESFIYLDRGDSGVGEATELWPIFHPVTVIASKEIAGQIDGFVVNVNGRKIPLLPSECLWLRYPHPTNPYGCQAPWRAASWAAELDQQARAWQLGEYLNGARPEGIFYLGDVDEAAHNATVEAWRSRHVGARNALKHLFVSGPSPANYVRVGLTAQEMSYIESRKVSAEEQMLAFGVHPDLLRGGATYENQRAAKTNLWSEVLVPKLEVVSSEADRQLLPNPNESFVFDISRVEALQENEDARVERVQRLVRTDLCTMDEGREMLQMEPLKNGAGALTWSAYKAALGVAPSMAAGAMGTGRALPAVRARAGTRIVAVSIEQVEKQYERLEAQGVKAVRALAAKQERVVLRKLKELQRKRAGQRVNGGDLYDTAYWTDYSRDHFDTFVSGVYSAGSMTTAGALGIGFDVFDSAVTAAMAARLDVLAGQVTETTRSAIEAELLKEGVEQGESIPDLAARLTSVFDTLSTSRATTIARTETVGGYNEASHATARASGLTTHRQWVATLDKRTRPTHVELDGYETNGMSDAYPNGCRFPGDPAGPSDETINCRCVELYAIAD